MQHSFDVDIAVEYGILEAILLNNLWFWIKKNEANKVNYFDNDYWTYNSIRAFGELFPYVSQKQIQNALKHLENEGLIKTGNYNKSTYDRTLWYAFDLRGKSIMQKSKMEIPKKENGLVENVEPIPYINTDINTNNNSSSKENDENIFDYLQKNGFSLTPIEIQIVMEWDDNELTRYAIKQAVLNHVFRIKYIDSILNSYKKDNIKTLQEAIARDEKFKNKKGKIIEEGNVPEWFNKNLNIKEESEDDDLNEEERKLINEILGRDKEQTTNNN